MKYYAAKMENGDVYGVPAEIIAKNYADYYAKEHGEDYKENFDAMMNWFDSGDYEFADWAKDNMNWEDVKRHAVLLESETKEPDYQEGWVNGDYEYRNTEGERCLDTLMRMR